MSYFKTCEYCGANLDPGEMCDCRDLDSAFDTHADVYNMHQKYARKFAANHGMSLHEALQQPMVKAHLECLIGMKKEQIGFFQNGA